MQQKYTTKAYSKKTQYGITKYFCLCKNFHKYLKTHF